MFHQKENYNRDIAIEQTPLQNSIMQNTLLCNTYNVISFKDYKTQNLQNHWSGCCLHIFSFFFLTMTT